MQLAREDTKTLPEYLQRCEQLEPAINDYEAAEKQMDNLFVQVQEQINELKPKADYANLTPFIEVLRAIMGKDLEAATAYRKEIAFAKQLPAIPATDRLRFYNSNIQPVLAQESQIAKEEIEIMRESKARGIKLPENLLQDAGIK